MSNFRNYKKKRDIISFYLQSLELNDTYSVRTKLNSLFNQFIPTYSIVLNQKANIYSLKIIV